VWRSRRCCLTGTRGIVVRQPWIPLLEQGPERAVEGTGAGLQQQVCAPPCPLHLLALGETLADHRVDRALGHGRRDALAGAEPLAVVDQAASIGRDVDRELMGRPGELAEVRVVQLQVSDVVTQVAGVLPGTVPVARACRNFCMRGLTLP